MYENLLKAIDARRSVRGYLDREIELEVQSELNRIIDEVNEPNSFRFDLIINDPEAFASAKRTYGVFNNVKNYITIIVDDNDPDAREKVGYYGERIVLEATAMGLSTCWVYLTFDRKNTMMELKPTEQLIGVISIGYSTDIYSEGDKQIYAAIGSRNKNSVDYFYKCETEAPQWFMDGVTAVSKAPTGANMQPVVFTYDNGKVTAAVERKAHTAEADLGITKFHFVIGAGGGSFAWGDKGEYTR